jgi:hypothetical protein
MPDCKIRFAPILSLAVLAACSSVHDDLVASGARPLDANEVRSQLVGNTEIWTKGAGYYAEDGTLRAVWEGESYTGTWEIRDNGDLCYTVAAWGGTDCQSYFVRDGEVILAHQNGSRPVEHLEGDQLSTI